MLLKKTVLRNDKVTTCPTPGTGRTGPTVLEYLQGKMTRGCHTVE